MTEKMAGTKFWCPFYRGVRLIWVSVLRGLTVYIFPLYEVCKGHRNVVEMAGGVPSENKAYLINVDILYL